MRVRFPSKNAINPRISDSGESDKSEDFILHTASKRQASDGTMEKAKDGNERNPRIDAQETSGPQASVVESTGDKR